MKSKHGILRMLCCVTLLLCVMTGTVAAKDKDVVKEVENYAKTLAQENGLAVGSCLSESSSGYTLNSTSASNGRDLFVVELKTIKGYETLAGNASNCHMDCAIYYQGTDNKVYWTDYFDFNKAAEDFMDKDGCMKDGQTDMMSIQLKNCKKILGFYFHKAGGPIQGKYPWSGEWLRIAKVSGAVGAKGEDGGFVYRDYSGTYMAGISNLNQLNSNGWGHQLWRLQQPTDTANTSCGKSVYAVELVAGSDGYLKDNGSVTINYTDCFGMTVTRSVSFANGANKFFPEDDSLDICSDGWLRNTNSTELYLLATMTSGITYRSCHHPYTARTVQMVMPQNISKINSIKVQLDEDDTMILQSVRLIELSDVGTSYQNGGMGPEATYTWQGRVIASSKGKNYTIPGKNSITFSGDLETRGLQNYGRGAGPVLDNRGEGVAVSVQFADVQGAGIETLLAGNRQNFDQAFWLNSEFETMFMSRAGNDAIKAYGNLLPQYEECMSLEVTYKDVLGATRRAYIPFMTTYFASIVKDNGAKLSGGDWKTWISGVLQQNDNAALPLRLAQYESLESIKLAYGAMPLGAISDGRTEIDTSNDTIAVENICFYEGVTETNFNSKYDTKKLTAVLKTELMPVYSYRAATDQGQKLAKGSSISASVAGATLNPGAPAPRDMTNKYLVKIKTADIETAGTSNPVSISLTYTDTMAAQRTTPVYSLPTLAGNYYGDTYRGASATYQYERHMRRNCLCEFVVEIKDVQTIDSISLILDGTNEWQIEYITVYKLEELSQRWGERSDAGSGEPHLYWRRDYNTDRKVAHARQDVLLYQRSPSKTIQFITYDEAGNATQPEVTVKKEEYLTSLPSSMTYEETRKNLGLSVVKNIYQVNVDVADVEDAGSGNYFYFQLLFQNGSSAVVLANQQLASDSFRQGATESFQIKTAQNYGNILAVRIICDNTSSTSNVFDKLNIEKITITMQGDTGVSKSWLVEQVGWIDITYVDEGADIGVEGLDQLTGSKGLSNAEIIKEFPVTGTATAVDLLFCIATANTSAGDSSDTLKNALQGNFEGTLIYRDGNGVEQNLNFDITKAIQTYNDTDKTFWLYRPNHVDRFSMSMTDISAVLGMIITRTGGRNDTKWVIDSISVQQIGGLGDVYLSPVLSEYMREVNAATDLAVSTNEAGITIDVTGNSSAAITFGENAIDIISREDQDAWNASISRVPNTTSESLNVYVYPGSTMGVNYQFTSSSPALRATAKYTTLYGGNLVQNAFVFGSLGEINGKNVLYGKGMPVSAMASLRYLMLSSAMPNSSYQPYIGKVVVERVRGDVLMGTYYFDFGGFYLGNGNPEYGPSSTMSATPMHQVVRLQPASGQAVPLVAESSDIAVALRYTSNQDPAPEKTVYQSSYVYLTDVGCFGVTTGQMVEVPFEVSNVDQIVGLSVVSSGPNVEFDNAIVYNYSGAAGAEQSVLLGSGSLAQSFTTSTIPSVLSSDGQTVTTARFRITTAAEEVAVGAGTTGQVDMKINYVDGNGSMRQMSFDGVLARLTGAATPTAGSVVDLVLQLNDAAYLDSVEISAQDDWLITHMAAELTLPDNSTSTSATTVNNWAGRNNALTVDLRPDAYRDSPNPGNSIQSFTVSGRGRIAGIPASASSGETLMVTAYPGDTVELTPVVTAVGSPDTSWSWNVGEHTGNLTIRQDGTASFFVPHSTAPGTSKTFSVTCSGDNRLTVAVTIAVEAEPQPEVILPQGDISE